MGEVGVDPQRVAQAASALEELRDALAANVPVIVNTMTSYGSGHGLSVLQQAQHQSPTDAADMRARARLAALWLHQEVSVSGPGLVDIPWDHASVDKADAYSEAQALAAAEANGDVKAIQAIQQDIKDHLAEGKSGSAWLTAFYDQAAPSVAKLAQMLHTRDASGHYGQNNFTVLTTADQQILATFGQGLAAADKAGLSPSAVQAIVHAPDLWSSAMLVKYGPKGSAWATAELDPQQASKLDQPSLLSQLTVSLFKAQQNGTLRIPIGGGDLTSFQQQANAQQKDGTTLLQDRIADFEPLSALLKADAENGAAAWQTLGDSDKMTFNGKQVTVGDAFAKELLALGTVPGAGNLQYTYSTDLGKNGAGPGYVTAVPPIFGNGDGHHVYTYNTIPSSTLAAFLTAATSGGRGEGDPNSAINQYKLSAQAAANIVMNTPPGWFDDGKPHPSYDPAVEKALTTTFMRYLPDIARSSRNDGPFSVDDSAGGWEFRVPQANLSPFLQQLGSTPQNYGYIKGAVASKAGLALAMQLKGVGQDGTDPYADLTSLYGRLIDENNNLHYEGGTLKDAEDAQLNAEISFAESFIGDIPVVGKTAATALSWDQKMSVLGFPQIPQFSTDNAAQAAAQGKQAYNEAELTAMIPIVQGLAQQNVSVYDKKDGWQNVAQEGIKEGWYQNGQVVPNAAFWQWWGHHDGTYVQDHSAPTPKSGQLDDYYQNWLAWMRLQKDVSDKTGGS